MKSTKFLDEPYRSHVEHIINNHLKYMLGNFLDYGPLVSKLLNEANNVTVGILKMTSKRAEKEKQVESTGVASNLKRTNLKAGASSKGKVVIPTMAKSAWAQPLAVTTRSQSQAQYILP